MRIGAPEQRLWGGGGELRQANRGKGRGEGSGWGFIGGWLWHGRKGIKALAESVACLVGETAAVACRSGVRHQRGRERKETRGRRKGNGGTNMRGQVAREREGADACGRLTRGRLTAWGQERSEGERGADDACGRGRWSRPKRSGPRCRAMQRAGAEGRADWGGSWATEQAGKEERKRGRGGLGWAASGPGRILG